MDFLHYFLISIIIIIIIVNNVSMIRKYYFPWFFSSCKKICKYIGKYFQKNISNNTSKSGSNERKIFDFYKNMNLKDNDFKLIQKKLSWPYQIAVFNLNSNLNVGAIYRTGCLLGMEKYLVLGKKIYNPFAVSKRTNMVIFGFLILLQ